MNDLPVLDLNGSDLPGIGFASVYVPDGRAVLLVDPARLVVGDADDPELHAATARIENLLDVGQEILSVVSDGTSITASYEASTGVLLLSGTDTLGHYRQVLRTLTYRHLATPPAGLPDPTPRTIGVFVHDGEGNSSVATSLVEFAPLHLPPALDLNGGEPGSAFGVVLTASETVVSVVAADATCTDADSPTLASITVRIVDLSDGIHEALLADVSGTTISGNYDTVNGTLTLTGVDTLEHYQRVLRTLRYQNTAPDRALVPRQIRFVAHDGLDESEPVVATVELVGGTAVVWGYVYADVNNNGIKDPPELGLPNVPVALTGPVNTVHLTREDGSFSFAQLPPGTYHLVETQPAAFMDGIDTMVDSYSGWVENDHFHAMTVDAGAAVRCDFGELGLHTYLISKKLYLASSPPALAMIQDLMISGDQWIGFRADKSGVLHASLEGASSEPVLELYTGAFMPVVVGPGLSSLVVPIAQDETYILHASHATPTALNVNVTGGSSIVTIPWLDVNSDASVTPLDALLVINRLTSSGTGPAGTQNHLDVNRDGIVSPLDALLVINRLNRPGDGEGEFVAASQRVLAGTSPLVDATYSHDPVRSGERELSQPEDVAGLWHADPAWGLFPTSLPHGSDARIDRLVARLKLRLGELTAEDLEDILEDIAGDIESAWNRRHP